MSKSSIEKKQAFLDNYPKIHRILETCKAITMRPATFYVWLSEDGAFKESWERLKKEEELRRLEQYEGELDNRALGGTSKQSDILLMFGLKALAPGKYREKVADTRLIGDITIKMAIPGYDESLRLTDGNVIEGEYKEGNNAIQGQGETEASQQGLNEEKA